MIVQMLRVRIAGPRLLLDRALTVLQDLAVVHVDRPRIPDGRSLDPAVARERRHVERCLLDVETALERVDYRSDTDAVPETPSSFASAARRARRVRREAEAVARERAALEDERSLLGRYRAFVQAFETLAGHELTWPDGQSFFVILRADAGAALDELRRRLEAALEGEVELVHQELTSGERAVLILASSRSAPKVSGLLAASRIDELPAPPNLGEKNLLRAVPAIKARLAEIAKRLMAVDSASQALAKREAAWLCRFHGVLRDHLLRLEARASVFASDRLFVIEGWLPSARLNDLEQQMRSILGGEVVVSTVRGEGSGADTAPVTLQNPPLFQPFELLTRALPLPKYGTIDPTPFVAVFFPAFFGLMVGDVGYGVMLAALAMVLRMKSRPDTPLRSISIVALACSSSAITFGVLFGEFFGSFGHAAGLRPVFNREEAMLPFLGFAIALGGVHILLGLVLAGLTAWRTGHRREAMGRGVALTMLILITLALLAALGVLPAGLFTPLAVAMLVAFTALIALEGVVAVIELVSTLGHILSYARIMALGIASLMLAVVANEMVGAMGSVLVGAVFALLFHLVNFAIGLFSPTIHALRLHYVEFFGHFFSPGGTVYRPFGHWQPVQ